MEEFVPSLVIILCLIARETIIIKGERVLSCEAVKNVLSLMFSCGMYNYSGQFAYQADCNYIEIIFSIS